MRIILLGTGDIALKVFLKLKNDNRIEMKGVICDDSVKEEVNAEYQRQIEENGGKILSFEEESIKDADAVFTCEYRKAIPQKYVDKYMFLNCHAGILPKYRGFSANPWAIMNGEQQIGYTIHRMDEKLDNGDIYYVGKFPISYQQTYADLYDTIFDDMIDRIPGILAGIYEGTIRATKQEKSGVYCSKFNAGMGNLGNFDKPSDYIVNLHRCMARPHGTGIFFFSVVKDDRPDLGWNLRIGDLQRPAEVRNRSIVHVRQPQIDCKRLQRKRLGIVFPNGRQQPQQRQRILAP